MWHCVATIEPLNPVSGVREAVRVASADLAEICALDGAVWEPAMLQPPSLALRTFNGDFGDGVGPGALAVALALDVLSETYPNAEDHDWSRAPVTLYAGKADTAWPWATMFKGRIRDYGNSERKLTFQAEVDTEPFDADVLSLIYAGTGGAEGGADIAGRVKPLILGHAKNVEPVLINAVDSVYQFSGYGPIEAVSGLFERASDFGPAMADFTDYAGLTAATIPPGRWATCLALGLVRLGAPAFGVITGDIRGHIAGASTPRLTGAMIKSLAALAGIDPALLNDATLDAMDADKPYFGNLVLSEQTSFIDVARRLALDCNHQSAVSLTGRLFVAKPDFAGVVDISLDAQGRSEPQVVGAPEDSTSAPYAKFTMGADRCWRVHSVDELAGGYVPKGIYDAATFYRRDDWVFAPAPDGRAFAYINAAPGAGHALPVAPATSNAHWTLFGSANVGVETTRSPDAPPAGPPVGSLHIDDLRYTYRFEGAGLVIGGEALQFGEQLLETTGYVRILPEPVATGGLQINVTPPSDQIVYTNFAGVELDNQFPRTLTPQVKRGSDDIRTSPDCTYAITTNGITASINNVPGSPDKGRITVTAGRVGSIELTVTVAGVTHGPFRVRFNTQQALAPNAGGSGSVLAQDTTFAPVSSTSFSEVAGPLTVTVGTGQAVTCSFPAVYSLTANVSGSAAVTGRWETSPAGTNTWTAAPDSPVTGREAQWFRQDWSGEIADGDFNQSIPGLTAGDYDVRFVGALSQAISGGVIEIFSGTATVQVQ